MNVVSIKWIDIMTYSEMTPLSVAKDAKFAMCETVGYLVYEDDSKVILAQSLKNIPDCPEPFVSEYTVIPDGCIIERKTLPPE
jgi:hypothetical protein